MKAEQCSKQRTIIDNGGRNAAHLLSHCCFHTDCGIVCGGCCISDTVKGACQGGISAADRRIRQRDAVIPFQKRVIFGFCNLGTGFNAQLRDIHMNRITERDLFCLYNILISGCIPKLNEVDFNVDLRLCQAGRINIVLCILSQSRFRWLFLKGTGAVQHRNLLIRHRFSADHDHFFWQFHNRLCFVVHPVRMHSCNGILDGFLHLEIRQVFAVDDMNVVVRTSGSVKLDCVAVPLELSSKSIQYRTIHTAQTVSERCRNGHSKHRTGCHICPN